MERDLLAMPREHSHRVPAHHQYPKDSPLQITVSLAITINGWANNHSLGSGFVKSEEDRQDRDSKGDSPSNPS